MGAVLFDCELAYTTRAGHERKAHYRIMASAADLALDRAEVLLRSDKRRDVAAVTYGDAIQR